MLRSKKRTGFSLIGTFVEFAIFKSDGKATETIAREFPYERRRYSGVNPSTEICADWHVRAQADTRCILQQMQ